MRRRRLLASASLLFTLAFNLALSSPAAADEEESFKIGSRPAWYLMGGVTSGATVASADKGAFVGGELSFVRLREGRFFGFYGDGYYDFGIKGAYTTAGIELGYKFIGIDGGGALRFAPHHTDGPQKQSPEPGATGRLFFTLGIFSIYGRYLYVNAFRDEHVVQIGALLKFPLLQPLGTR